jgi:hypothetical protein
VGGFERGAKLAGDPKASSGGSGPLVIRSASVLERHRGRRVVEREDEPEGRGDDRAGHTRRQSSGCEQRVGVGRRAIARQAHAAGASCPAARWLPDGRSRVTIDHPIASVRFIVA